jgi:hypothetical protein
MLLTKLEIKTIIYFILVLICSCVTPANVDAHWVEITPYQHYVYYDGNNSNLQEAGYIWVKNVDKWYYYKNHVIGKSSEHYFVFNELTKELRFFSEEQEWELFLEKQFLYPQIRTRWYAGQYTWGNTAFLILFSIPCSIIISEYVKKKLNEENFAWDKRVVKNAIIFIFCLIILYLLEVFPQSL